MSSRIEKALMCKDCDPLNRVENAGKIFENFQVMHNGIKVTKDGYCGPWMTTLISDLKGHHEPQEELAFSLVLKKIGEGGSMIELGSSWAYYSMWFNKEVKNPKNFMIDVDELNLNIGKENFKLNGMDGDFTIGKIPDLDILEFIRIKGISFVDILHVDIQGWEYHLLNQINSSIEKIGYIFISTHTDSNNPGKEWGSPDEFLHEKCLSFIKEKGFVVLCEHNMDESYSHDGLIVAKNPSIDLDFNKIEISKYKA